MILIPCEPAGCITRADKQSGFDTKWLKTVRALRSSWSLTFGQCGIHSPRHTTYTALLFENGHIADSKVHVESLEVFCLSLLLIRALFRVPVWSRSIKPRVSLIERKYSKSKSYCEKWERLRAATRGPFTVSALPLGRWQTGLRHDVARTQIHLTHCATIRCTVNM